MKFPLKKNYKAKIKPHCSSNQQRRSVTAYLSKKITKQKLNRIAPQINNAVLLPLTYTGTKVDLCFLIITDTYSGTKVGHSQTDVNFIDSVTNFQPISMKGNRLQMLQHQFGR